MTMVSIGVAAVGLLAGGASARKERKRMRNDLIAQRSALAQETDRTSKALLLEADATNRSREEVQARLLLSDQAEDEASRQARNAEGPEVTLGEPPAQGARARQSRRKRFYGQADEGVLL